MFITESQCRDLAALHADYIGRDEASGSPDREHYNKFFEGVYTTARKMGRQRDNISLTNLFEALVPDGREYLRWNRSRSGGRRSAFLSEALGQPVDTSAFRHVVGQFMFAETMDMIESESFIWQNLCTIKPKSTKFQEIVPAIAKLGNVAQKVAEGQSYPRIGMSANHVVTPESTKDGFIVELTQEVVQEEKTGQLLERVRGGVESMGIAMERENLACFLGLTTTFRWNELAPQATYSSTHTGFTLDNLIGDNSFNGTFASINAMLALFDNMIDPTTGEPVNISGDLQFVVPFNLKQAAVNLFAAYELRFGPGGATTADAEVYTMPTQNTNSARGDKFTVVSNRYVSQITGNSTTCFLGKFNKAFAYGEYWPVQGTDVTFDQTEKFDKDVVAGYKFNRHGVPYVVSPWHVVKSIAGSDT